MPLARSRQYPSGSDSDTGRRCGVSILVFCSWFALVQANRLPVTWAHPPGTASPEKSELTYRVVRRGDISNGYGVSEESVRIIGATSIHARWFVGGLVGGSVVSQEA